jgi:WD40 repeat protein
MLMAVVCASLFGFCRFVRSGCVAFHPQLPIILSGSEDGTVRIWHSQTYRLENTLNYVSDVPSICHLC